ncbi:MAG: hypothetical protein LBM01_02630 [Christensenellaceae bacterium]|jgi:hypothetical protein|nr:hypothetical protein [Christensenellaceae bacterium]
MQKSDLHIHLDGNETQEHVVRILQRAEQEKLKSICMLTRNDFHIFRVGGVLYEMARKDELEKHYSGKIIPGMELRENGKHTILYGFNPRLNYSGSARVLAHPLKSKNLDLLDPKDFDGAEYMHYAQSQKDSEQIKRKAESLGLFLTGGSDYVWRPDGKGKFNGIEYDELSYLGKSFATANEGHKGEILIEDAVISQFDDIRSML